METPTTLKSGLIFALALVLTALILRLAPRREMNMGSCGPRALHAVAVRLGCPQSEAQILALFPNSGFNVTLGELAWAAPKLGLSAQARQMTVADLRREKPLGVLHIDDTHFVAVVGYDGDTLQIVDPLYRGEARPVDWLFDDLKVRWDGAILVVTLLPGSPSPRQRK